MKFRHLIGPTAAAFFMLGSTAALAQAAPAVQKMKEECAGDVAKLCPTAKPGSGEIAACLKANEAKLSMGCKVAAMKAHKAAEAAKGQ